MRRFLLFVAGMAFLSSCNYLGSPVTVNREITSQYLLDGNLNTFIENNQILRLKGKPGFSTISVGNADLSKYEQCFVLHVTTGTTPETSVSSAIIKLDDVDVLTASDFSKHMGQFTFEICNLTPTSVLSVEVRGAPGSYVNIWIEGKFKGLIDVEGNAYKTVKIGNQTWMAENLKSTKYNDGSPIPYITDYSTWGALTSPAYSWLNNDASNKSSYGALYNWYSVNTGHLCLVDWHVPTSEDWGILNNYLLSNGYGYGGIDWQVAKSMAATSGWTESSILGAAGNDQAGNNSSGFTGQPAGYRSEYGWFGDVGERGWWWSSTESYSGFSNGSVLIYHLQGLSSTTMSNQVGFSVRCVKNN